MVTLFWTWLAAFLTLAIFSFLYKDNPFYKIAEHIYVGISAGYWAVFLWNNYAWPNLFAPIFKEQRWLFIIPAILGMMMFAQLIPRISWMVRLPLTLVMGVGLGYEIIALIQGDLLPQLRATFLNLGTTEVMSTFSNLSLGAGIFLTRVSRLLVVLGVIVTLIYFYFSKEHKGMLKVGAQMGIWFLMMAFGASFGYTVMGRVSLLIGRIQFLLMDWLHLIK